MPSAMLTAGRQPVASRNGRGSNQWASASWSTRNRVAGGSASGRARSPHALRRTGHQACEPERKIPAGRRHPRSRADLLEQHAHRQRLPVRDDEPAPGERAAGPRAARRRRRGHRLRCRRRSCRSEPGRRRRRTGAPSARARRSRPTSCVSPGPQITCGRIADTASASSFAASATSSASAFDSEYQERSPLSVIGASAAAPTVGVDS